MIELPEFLEVTMKNCIVFLTLILLSVFFYSCENDFHSPCDQASINGRAYSYMKDWYLWYGHLPDIDPGSYETMKEMLADLKYHDGERYVDRFSYTVKTEAHDDYYAGRSYGMGTSWKRDENNDLFVSLVYPGSPAGVAGLKRGQQILAINDFTVEELDDNKEYNKENPDDKKTDWTNVYDSSNDGEPVDMTLLEGGEKTIETTVYLGDYTRPSVINPKVIDNAGVKTGYLMFKSFIDPSKEELNEAFAVFKEEGIEALVLDMRYNGGGKVYIAHQLVNLIGGEKVNGEAVIKLIYNSKHQDSNYIYKGEELKSSVNIEKVAIIATRGTASASEMVINSLTPYVEVAVIGDTTYGKPVGMNARSFCNQTLVPITFKNANSEDFGDYFFGIDATCQSDDDIKHDFGDTLESSMKEALYYLENGECSVEQAAPRFSPYLETLIPFELEGMNRIDYTF